MFQWMLIKKLCELTGITDDAVRAKIKRGHWLDGIHWKKGPDGRIYCHFGAIQKWIEEKA